MKTCATATVVVLDTTIRTCARTEVPGCDLRISSHGHARHTTRRAGNHPEDVTTAIVRGNVVASRFGSAEMERRRRHLETPFARNVTERHSKRCALLGQTWKVVRGIYWIGRSHLCRVVVSCLSSFSSSRLLLLDQVLAVFFATVCWPNHCPRYSPPAHQDLAHAESTSTSHSDTALSLITLLPSQLPLVF